MAQKPYFNDSELILILEAVKKLKISEGKFCDSDGLAEIELIVLKIETYQKQDHNEFKALNELTHYLNKL